VEVVEAEQVDLVRLVLVAQVEVVSYSLKNHVVPLALVLPVCGAWKNNIMKL
jgi:hypothetical protein